MVNWKKFIEQWNESGEEWAIRLHRQEPPSFTSTVCLKFNYSTSKNCFRSYGFRTSSDNLLALAALWMKGLEWNSIMMKKIVACTAKTFLLASYCINVIVFLQSCDDGMERWSQCKIEEKSVLSSRRLDGAAEEKQLSLFHHRLR